MRILILGAGGIGGYFGARMVAAGADVAFLVRPARAAELARDGLVVVSPLGDLRVPVSTLTRADSVFDTVIVACKAYDLNDAIEAIAPSVGASTFVLPLLNGLRQLDALDQRFGAARVIGGLCHIGVTVKNNGEIHHLNTLQRLALGPRTPAQEKGSSEVHAALSRGGFAPTLSATILHDMWEKFVFLATYAGVTCLMRASIGAVVATDEGEAVTLELFGECCAVASASGYPPRPAFLTENRSALTARASAGTSSMLRDIWRGARTEQDHILGDMLARAERVGLVTPTLRIARAALQAYEAARSQDAIVAA